MSHSQSTRSGVVRDHVSAQVAGVVEAGCALAARVWLLSRVSPQVDLQAAVLREAFPTLHTGVRLLARVNAHVDAQSGLVDKRLAAIGARNWRLPGVTRTMHNQLLAAEEALAAEAAVEGFADGLMEDSLLLGELADVTGVPHLTISSHYMWL